MAANEILARYCRIRYNTLGRSNFGLPLPLRERVGVRGGLGTTNRLVRRVELTRASPLPTLSQYCSARILLSGAFRRNLKKLSKSMIIPLARSLHLAHLITSQHGPRQGRTQFDSVMPRCPENEGQRSTLTLSKLSDELKLPLPLPI